MKNGRLFATVLALVATAASLGASESVTVRPANTDEALINPGMGFYFYKYSNRLWAYGSQQEPGDTLDWFPGCSTIYFRLPWCELEPEEGDYRWDLIDTYAQPWIAKGKRIAFRITTCENRYVYPTPKWVFDAGAKYKPYNMHDFSKNWTDEILYEPDYTDPVYLRKLENFLKAFAARYDGKPYVDFIDIGSFGLWGEGHTFYTSKLDSKQTLAVVKVHMDLWRRCLPNSYLVICDDVGAGTDESVNDNWVVKPDSEAMQYARSLGIGFRDDSVMVWKYPKMFQRDNWARLFAPTSPVIVEHDHYVLTQRDRGPWEDKWLVEAVKAYRASWMSIHGFPRQYLRERADAVKAVNKILGYRFELREVTYPACVGMGERFDIRATWANVGVAKCYRGGFAAWTLLDAVGNVVWSSTDEANDFAGLPPAYDGSGEQPRTFTSRVRFGCTSELPRRNDGVLKQLASRDGMTFGGRVPTMKPGTYSLCVSVGSRDGTPEIMLPLAGKKGKRYPIGKITVRDDAPLPSPTFSFDYGAAHHVGIPAEWSSRTSVRTEKGRRVEQTRARAPDGLEMTVDVTRYDNDPVVEWSLSFTNNGTNNSARIRNLSAGDFTLLFGQGETATLWRGVGEMGNRPNRETAERLNYSYSYTTLTNGVTECLSCTNGWPAFHGFPYFRVYSPTQGYTVAIGWQGQWSASVKRTADGVRVAAGQETLDIFLKPGETVVSPTITVLGFTDGERGVNDWRRFMRRWILPRAEGGTEPIRPILAFDVPGGRLYETLTAADAVQAIRQARAKGLRMDALWVDAGWYQRKDQRTPDGKPVSWYSGTGTWVPDPARFPQGFRPVADELAKEGAKLILWYEPERVQKYNAFYPSAKPFLAPLDSPGTMRYDLSRPETVDFLAEVIGTSVVSNGVRFFRQDMNGPAPILFWRAIDAARADDRNGLAENLSVQGEFRFWNELRRRQPGLLFDTCAGGGRRNDLSTLRFPAVPLHYTDTGYTNYVEKLRYNHMLNEWLFYRKNISWFFHDSKTRRINRRKAVIDLAQMHTVRSDHYLRPEPWHVQEEDQLIGVWRRTASLLTDGDYYLLTPATFGDDKWWVTQFHDPRTGSGFLQVVAPVHSSQGKCTVMLKGVSAGLPVKFTDLFSNTTFGGVSGTPLHLEEPQQDATVIAYEICPKRTDTCR